MRKYTLTLYLLKSSLGLAIPTSMVVYSLWEMQITPNTIGLVDHLTFILFFFLIFTAIGLVGRSSLKLSVRLLWSGFIVIYFFGNLIHYRFFQTWLPISALWHWHDLLAIRECIFGLFRWQDIFFGIAVPLLLVFLAHGTSPQANSRFLSWMLLVLLVLFATHARVAAASFDFREQNPFFDLVRQQYRKWLLRLHAEEELFALQGRVHEFKLINKSLYKHAGYLRYPLEQRPVANATFNPFPFKPNVVLIFLESFRAFESGAYGSHPSYTPNFDRAATEGMQFKRFYANGSYTIKGEFSTLCSFLPDLYGGHCYIQFAKNHFDTLPAHLKKHGYHTHWISGLEADFEAVRSFLSKRGIDQFHDSIPNPKKVVLLGASDEDIYVYANDILSKAKEPFFAEVLTLSNHFPFDAKGAGVVNKRLNEEEAASYENYLRGVQYADRALGQFLAEARKSSWGVRTIFLITGDHGLWLFPNEKSLDEARKVELYYRLPFIIWSPQLIKPGTNNTLGSQLDIAPTVLDLLNIREKNSFLGTSLLRNDTDDRFVFMLHDERWNLRNENTYLYDTGAEGFLEHFPYVNAISDAAKTTHAGFAMQSDLLHTGDPNMRIPLEPNQQHLLESFAFDALKAYSTLLYNDCVAKD